MTEHGLEHLASPEVIVRHQDDPGTQVRLCDRYFPDEHGIGFAVEIRADGLQARLDSIETWVWDHKPLTDFLDGLAADFRGWDGERTWSTNHLVLRAVFNSGGHVALTWTLIPWTTRQDAWEASVTTWLEAGEEMSALAADLREFLTAEDVARG
ncbi:DUF6228 family protein [Streptomyces sp. RPT161]|uniref:DUF6228 family protein n=1 Tax=Streptomyces sp. RPT161 TaxID=3015993 RepID=UPI0022B8E65E|nr:DUF6228 family protein [Streptomyces sp. RPT161]